MRRIGIYKIVAIVLLIPLSWISLKAQVDGYFTAGYNVSLMKLDSLNFIIRRYNETRSWLDDELNEVHSPGGITFGGGVYVGPAMFDMSYAGRSKKVSASGIAPANGLDVQRDLKFKLNTFRFGVGFGSKPTEKSWIGLGFLAEFGTMKLLTRVGEVQNIKEVEYEEVYNSLNSSMGIFLRIHVGNPGIVIEPYYLTSLLKQDVQPLNVAINPVTHPADPSDINTKVNMFGFRIMACISSFGMN